MRRLKLSARLFMAMAGLSILSVVLMAAAGMAVMRRLNADVGLFTLEQSARALADLAPRSQSGAQEFCDLVSRGSSIRVTLVAPDGTVLGDSHSDPAGMENHAARPELASALAGTPLSLSRRSDTLGLDMAYAAAPVTENGRVGSALRLALASPELSSRQRPFLVASAVLATILAAGAAISAARLGASFSRPALALMRAAEAWSAGQLMERARGVQDPDFGALAATMNDMAGQLASRMADVEARKTQLDAILGSLDEGVIAVDGSLNVVLMNPRARDMFATVAGGPGVTPIGRHILEATGKRDVERLAGDCAASGKALSAEITVYGERTAILLARAAPLSSLSGRAGGAVIALTDLSEYRRLERVRADFVANVSHELRTPITLIKGFSEALADRDLDPGQRERFISIIGRHADRMGSIIDDLLTLARLENDDQRQAADLRGDLAAAARHAVESVDLARQARRATIRMRAEWEPEVAAPAGLVEQAIINLLDNAIKYGPEGGTVELDLAPDTDPGYARLSVKDQGPGIPAADLPRIFERFYRVDKARSREQGGTGLGLAIVRHIALASGGSVEAAARPGGGSVFTLRLPLAPGAATPQG